MSVQQTATLTDWFWDADHPILWGTVTGHPALPDGMEIHTSIVEYMNEEHTECITLNTRYILVNQRKEIAGMKIVEQTVPVIV